MRESILSSRLASKSIYEVAGFSDYAANEGLLAYFEDEIGGSWQAVVATIAGMGLDETSELLGDAAHIISRENGAAVDHAQRRIECAAISDDYDDALAYLSKRYRDLLASDVDEAMARQKASGSQPGSRSSPLSGSMESYDTIFGASRSPQVPECAVALPGMSTRSVDRRADAEAPHAHIAIRLHRGRAPEGRTRVAMGAGAQATKPVGTHTG